MNSKQKDQSQRRNNAWTGLPIWQLVAAGTLTTALTIGLLPAERELQAVAFHTAPAPGRTKLLEQQFATSPADVSTAVRLLDVYQELGWSAKRESMLARLARLQPANDRWGRELVALRLQARDLAGAIRVQRLRVANAPENRALREELVALSLQTGNAKPAAKELAAWWRDQPLDDSLGLRLRQAQLLAGDLAGAYQTASLLRMRHPDNQAFWDREVADALARHNLGQALRTAREWLGRFPGSSVAAARVAEILGWTGRSAEALRLARHWAAREPRNPEWRDLARKMTPVRHLKASSETLEQHLTRNPLHFWCHERFVDLAIAKGDTPAALAHATLLAGMAPERGTAVRRLAMLLAWVGRHDEGIRVLEAHARRQDATPWDRLESLIAGHDLAVRNGKADAAARLLEARLAFAPSHEEAWIALSDARLLLGDVRGAVDAAAAAARQRPTKANRVRLASLLIRASRPAEAAQILALASADGDRDTSVRRLLAAAQDAAGDRSAAATTLGRVLAEAPDDTQVRERLAYLLIDLGRQDEALSHFRLLGAKYPDDPDLALTRATLALGVGRKDEALDVLRTLLALRPHHAEVLALFASLVAPTDPDEAVRALAVLNAGPGATPRTLAYEGELRLALGQRDAALACFTRALETSDPAPRSPEALRERARLIAHLGRWREAALAFTQSFALTSDKTAAGPAVEAAGLWLAAEDFDRAKLFAQSALSRNGASRDLTTTAHRILAEIAQRHGDLFEAVRHLEILHSVQPGDAGLAADFAFALAGVGRTEQALDILRPWAAIWQTSTDPAAPRVGEALGVLGQDHGWQARMEINDERFGTYGRQRVETIARMPLGSSTSLKVTGRRRFYLGGRDVLAPDAEIALRQEGPGWKIETLVGMDDMDPLAGLQGRLGGRWSPPALRGIAVMADYGRSRWDATALTSAVRGQRDGGSAGLIWSFGDGWEVGIQAERHALLVGGPIGTETAGGLDISKRLIPDLPITAGYGYSERRIDGPAEALGLLQASSLHAVRVGFSPAKGPLALGLHPELQMDVRNGTLNLGLTGQVAWHAAPSIDVKAEGGVGTSTLGTTAGAQYYKGTVGAAARF